MNFYFQYPYNIYNPTCFGSDYLQQIEIQRQQAEMQRQQIEARHKHMEQQKNIRDMVKAISDYVDAARKIEPEYQQEAMNACIAEIVRQAAIDMNRQNGGRF